MTIKEIVAILLQDGFLTKSGHPARHKAYKLMDANVNPICYVSEAAVKRLKERDAVKKHKKGYLVISRRGLQHLHGKTLEKQTYAKRNQLQPKGQVSPADL